MTTLPKDHPKRFELSNEVHARPPYPISTPAKVSCIAMKTERPFHNDDRAYIDTLASSVGASPPARGKKYHIIKMDQAVLVWEHHTEFMRYTIIVEGETDTSGTALDALPENWVANLPGEMICAVHLTIAKAPDREAMSPAAKALIASDTIIGAEVAGGLGLVATDFQLKEDSFSRFVVMDNGLSAVHLGRTVQRLLDIETYRVMALQDLILKLSRWEFALSQITSEMSEPEADIDTELLERLTSLQAGIELSYAQNQFRFGAASAYYALVQRRTSELRESRVRDMQTFAEFIERRLAPAMNTSSSVESRMRSLSERVDRATQLLSTKVNITLEQQNQSLMESMDRRAALQLRLQQTVEGLSIAAISYYLIGIVNYIAKGMQSVVPSVNVELVTGVSVPFVLGVTSFSVWQMRRHLAALDPPEKRE